MSACSRESAGQQESLRCTGMPSIKEKSRSARKLLGSIIGHWDARKGMKMQRRYKNCRENAINEEKAKFKMSRSAREQKGSRDA